MVHGSAHPVVVAGDHEHVEAVHPRDLARVPVVPEQAPRVLRGLDLVRPVQRRDEPPVLDDEVLLAVDDPVGLERRVQRRVVRDQRGVPRLERPRGPPSPEAIARTGCTTSNRAPAATFAYPASSSSNRMKFGVSPVGLLVLLPQVRSLLPGSSRRRRTRPSRRPGGRRARSSDGGSRATRSRPVPAVVAFLQAARTPAPAATPA